MKMLKIVMLVLFGVFTHRSNAESLPQLSAISTEGKNVVLNPATMGMDCGWVDDNHKTGFCNVYGTDMLGNIHGQSDLSHEQGQKWLNAIKLARKNNVAFRANFGDLDHPEKQLDSKPFETIESKVHALQAQIDACGCGQKGAKSGMENLKSMGHNEP